MNSTGALGFTACFVAKKVMLVNFISSLYIAPVQVDNRLQNATYTSLRFEHTYLFFIISKVHIFIIVKSTMK